MLWIKKIVLLVVIASLLSIAGVYLVNRYSYFDILNMCYIAIHQDVPEGNREIIQKALGIIKQENSEEYKMICQYVDTISENFCAVISPDSPDVKLSNSKGCYVKGSKNIILVPQKETSDKAIVELSELIKSYAAKSQLYWQGFNNQNNAPVRPENILPTPTLTPTPKGNLDPQQIIPQITGEQNTYKDWQTFTDSSNQVSFMYPPDVPSFDLTNNPDVLKETSDNLPLLFYSFGSTKGELGGKGIITFTYLVRDFADLDSYASFIESRKSHYKEFLQPTEKITKVEYHKTEVSGNAYLMSSFVKSVAIGDTLVPILYLEAVSFVTKNGKVATIGFESSNQDSAIIMRDKIIKTLKH